MKSEDLVYWKGTAALGLMGLAQNPYPGRGIVIGTSEDGLHAVQIYWIMGRSLNSRNRIFSVNGGCLFTEPADPTKVKDPSLIIYNAMTEYRGVFIVSNGDQTDTVFKRLQDNASSTLRTMLADEKYEPDDPNFTPRITGICYAAFGFCLTELSILRRSELVGNHDDDDCQRSYHEYNQIIPGFGFCLHTYSGDGDPLPAFTGEPYVVPIKGNLTEVTEKYWSVLNPENRVALAVKFINLSTHKSKIKVINRFAKVAPTT